MLASSPSWDLFLINQTLRHKKGSTYISQIAQPLDPPAISSSFPISFTLSTWPPPLECGYRGANLACALPSSQRYTIPISKAARKAANVWAGYAGGCRAAPSCRGGWTSILTQGLPGGEGMRPRELGQTEER